MSIDINVYGPAHSPIAPSVDPIMTNLSNNVNLPIIMDNPQIRVLNLDDNDNMDNQDNNNNNTNNNNNANNKGPTKDTWISPFRTREENVDFFMYGYKCDPCPLRRSCPSKVTCRRWHHEGEKRRHPGLGSNFRYSEEPCPHVKGQGSNKWLPPSRCPNGDNCEYSHTLLEQMYHPNIYKTSMCINFTHPNGNKCQWGFYCTHAHGQDDIRNPPKKFSTNSNGDSNDNNDQTNITNNQTTIIQSNDDSNLNLHENGNKYNQSNNNNSNLNRNRSNSDSTAMNNRIFDFESGQIKQFLAQGSQQLSLLAKNTYQTLFNNNNNNTENNNNNNNDNNIKIQNRNPPLLSNAMINTNSNSNNNNNIQQQQQQQGSISHSHSQSHSHHTPNSSNHGTPLMASQQAPSSSNNYPYPINISMSLNRNNLTTSLSSSSQQQPQTSTIKHTPITSLHYSPLPPTTSNNLNQNLPYFKLNANGLNYTPTRGYIVDTDMNQHIQSRQRRTVSDPPPRYHHIDNNNNNANTNTNNNQIFSPHLTSLHNTLNKYSPNKINNKISIQEEPEDDVHDMMDNNNNYNNNSQSIHHQSIHLKPNHSHISETEIDDETLSHHSQQLPLQTSNLKTYPLNRSQLTALLASQQQQQQTQNNNNINNNNSVSSLQGTQGNNGQRSRSDSEPLPYHPNTNILSFVPNDGQNNNNQTIPHRSRRALTTEQEHYDAFSLFGFSKEEFDKVEENIFPYGRPEDLPKTPPPPVISPPSGVKDSISNNNNSNNSIHNNKSKINKSEENGNILLKQIEQLKEELNHKNNLLKDFKMKLSQNKNNNLSQEMIDNMIDNQNNRRRNSKRIKNDNSEEKEMEIEQEEIEHDDHENHEQKDNNQTNNNNNLKTLIESMDEASIDEQIKQLTGFLTCPACLSKDGIRNQVLIPCGHLICNSCQTKYEECPVCSIHIDTFQQLQV